MVVQDSNNCPICFKAAKYEALGPLDQLYKYDCERCGQFQITDEALVRLKEDEIAGELFKISAYTRERAITKKSLVAIVSSRQAIAHIQGAAIDAESIIGQFPQTISDRLDRVLRNIQSYSPYPGARFKFNLERDYPVFFAENPEACWFIGQGLENAGFISTKNTMGHIDGSLSVQGWDRLSKIEQAKSSAGMKQVFVAMSFDPSLDKAFKEGIEKAIHDAGYEALRMDLKEHNDKICDAIVAEIRRSRFMVAEFTGHRGGVYFEAGFAKGLGLEVIWIVREDDLDKTHFDTRQYNHIVWTNEQDLYEKLKRRIEATITS